VPLYLPAHLLGNPEQQRIYSTTVIGIVLLHKGSWTRLQNYVIRHTYISFGLDSLDPPKRIPCILDLVHTIITSRIPISTERNWIEYLEAMPKLSRINIINSDNYTTENLKKSIMKQSCHRELTVNGHSLQPCLQCKELCYPSSSCNSSKCKYYGTYNCERCICYNERGPIDIYTRIRCKFCSRNHHPSCSEAVAMIKMAKIEASARCLECKNHPHDDNDDNHHCQSCLELTICCEDNCDQLTCLRHERTCSKCGHSGCTLHIMTIRDSYDTDEALGYSLICQVCYT
jgi:hypothetical protein